MPNRQRRFSVPRVLTWIAALAVLFAAPPPLAFGIPLLSYSVAYDNPFKTVNPTEVIQVLLSITNTEPQGGDNIDQIIARSFSPGNLFSSGNPYDFTFAATTIAAIAPGVTALRLFGTLTPKNGVAPVGTFSSTFGSVQLANYAFTRNGPNVSLGTFTVNVVPEPSTMLLLGSGLAGLGFFRWRRKREA